MGTDYAARKAAKRKRKHSAAAGAPTVDADELDGLTATNAEDGASNKRERKKRPKVRRFCRGMCYSEPEKGLEGEIPGSAVPEESPDAAMKRKPRRRGSKSDAPGGLSTGVGLKDFVPRGDAPQQASELASQPPLLRRYLEAEGLSVPTDVQRQCWPVLAQGSDAEVLAPTGSGKTLGFLLPALLRLEAAGCLDEAAPPGPRVLVLAPTREVAAQTAAAALPMRGLFGLRCATLFGGADKAGQAARLGPPAPHLLVATPGRLLDMLDDGNTTLEHLMYIVLDEADKLLSLGFSDQLDRIRHLANVAGSGEAKTTTKRKKGAALVLAPDRLADAEGAKQGGRPQVALVTATMPASVEAAAAMWLTSPARVEVAHTGGTISGAITQVVQVCAEHKKPRKLEKHLNEIHANAPARNPPRILVFTNRIKTVRFVYKLLAAAKMRVAMLHGERSQAEREEAMLAFRSGKANVLVATDVAGRGLHIRGLPYIVNYDFPSNLDAYVHRVGRTGRLAANGHAYSFFTRSLARLAPPVVELLRAHGQPVDPNLVILADAWEEAVRQDPELAAALAGAEGGDEDEGDEEGEDHEDELEDVKAPPDSLKALRKSEKVKRGSRKADPANARPARTPAGSADARHAPPNGAAAGGKTGRRKALPGRLRKKLAKEAAAAGRK